MPCFRFGENVLYPEKRTVIMGILNVTPDSFSDGGHFESARNALAKALQMQGEGADILDVGAESTRPGCVPITAEEEWQRLSSVLPVLLKNCCVPVSVDTYHTQTAFRCLEMGVRFINDVSGRFKPETAELIKAYNAGWCLMHGGTESGIKEKADSYPLGVVNHVQLFFDEMLEKAERFGIPSENMVLDPGFGFSKTEEQNIELLKNLSCLSTGDASMLVGVSRKRFVGTISHDCDAGDRLPGSLAADIMAVYGGADMVRTHEIAMHKKALAAVDAVIKGK